MEPRSNSDDSPSGDLLESIHTFPGAYTIKAIGRTSDDFEVRLLAAVRAQLEAETDLEHSTRTTPGGRHVAVSLVVTARSAEHVRAIYTAIHDVEGVTLVI